MFSYRPDQGIYARGTAFWSLVAFAAFAGQRFTFEIQGWAWASGWMLHRLTDTVPVLGFPMTPSFVLGLALFAALSFAAWRIVNTEKAANLLIDTEQEMKKVTWPSFEDSKNASLVVIGFVVFMLLFLGFADLTLQWFFRTVVY